MLLFAGFDFVRWLRDYSTQRGREGAGKDQGWSQEGDPVKLPMFSISHSLGVSLQKSQQGSALPLPDACITCNIATYCVVFWLSGVNLGVCAFCIYFADCCRQRPRARRSPRSRALVDFSARLRQIPAAFCQISYRRHSKARRCSVSHCQTASNLPLIDGRAGLTMSCAGLLRALLTRERPYWAVDIADIHFQCSLYMRVKN